MAGSGIWLDDDTYQQTAGQIWAQGMHQQLQAGEDWAQQALRAAIQPAQDVLAKLQSMVPNVPTPQAALAPTAPPGAALQQAPPPAAEMPEPTPVPAPTPPLGVAAGQTPAAEVAPAAVPTQPTPPPAPTPEVAPLPAAMPAAAETPVAAGADWAQQQIQNLLNPTQPASQTAPVPATPAASTSNMGLPSAPTAPPPGAPSDLIEHARQIATAAGIDPDVFTRQIQQESGFDPNAKSGAGALGVAQLMPGTAKSLGVDPMDPIQALKGAAQLDAQNLQKYGGDWSKALAAYNAGPGAVDKYGGVPPFEETQRYVANILGDAKNFVQQTAQTGQTAVNTAVQGVQSAVARVSQFGMGLSSGDAMAFCGPAAAMAFAQTYGRNPTVDEAKQLAQQVGWNPNQGMAGPQSEVKLLNAMGIDAHMTQGVDWQTVGQDAASGNPVIIDTPGHYYYVDGFNQDTGKFHVGTSGTDLKGGSEWMSADQINAMPQSGGSARAAIFADHPLSGPGQAATMGRAVPQEQAAAAGPAQPGAPDLGQMLQAGQNLISGVLGTASSAVRAQASTIADAVLNVGGGLRQGAQDLLGGTQSLLGGTQNVLGSLTSDLTSDLTQVPQSISDTLTQNALISQGIPTLQNAVTSLPDLSAQGIAGGVGNLAQQAWNAPAPQGLSDLLNSPYMPSNILGAGERAVGQALQQGPLSNPLVQQLGDIRQQLFPTIFDPGAVEREQQQQQLSLSATQKLLQDHSDQVTPEEWDAFTSDMQRIGGVEMPETAAGNFNNLWQRITAPTGPASARPVTAAEIARTYHVGNVIGDTLTLSKVALNSAINPAWSFLSRGLGDIAGGVTGLAPDLTRGEAFGRAGGSILGAQTGLANIGDYLLDGIRAVQGNPEAIANRTQNPLGQIFGRTWATPAALHSMFQNAGQQVLEQIELGRLAGQEAASRGLTGSAFTNEVANLMANPLPGWQDSVSGLARRAVLRGNLGDLGQYFANMAGQGPGAAGTARSMIGNFLFPVFKIGMNAMTQGVEKTPLGAAGTLFDVVRGMAGAGPYAGGAFEAPVSKAVAPLSERLTNNIVGSAVTAALAKWALDGTITGDGPSDPAQRQVLAAQGWQPNSIRTPMGYISYKGTPIEVPAGLAGNFADVVMGRTPQTTLEQQQPLLMTAAERMFGHTLNMLASPTGLETLGNIAELVHGLTTGAPEEFRRGGASTIANLVSGYIPMGATLKGIERATDPYVRQAPQGDIGAMLASRIPGLAQTVQPQVDVLGRNVPNPMQGLGAFLPARLGPGESSPIAAAMGNAGVAPATTPQTIPYGPYDEIRLTPQERMTFEQYRGQLIQQMARTMVNSPAFQQMPPIAQRMALQQVTTAASDAAGKMILRDIVGSGTAQARMTPTGVLAPVQGYQPAGLGDQYLTQATMLRNQAAHQALMQSLLGGQTGLQALQAANAAAAYA